MRTSSTKRVSPNAELTTLVVDFHAGGRKRLTVILSFSFFLRKLQASKQPSKSFEKIKTMVIR